MFGAPKNIRHYLPTEVWGILPLTIPGDATFYKSDWSLGIYTDLLFWPQVKMASQEKLNHLHKT